MSLCCSNVWKWTCCRLWKWIYHWSLSVFCFKLFFIDWFMLFLSKWASIWMIKWKYSSNVGTDTSEQTLQPQIKLLHNEQSNQGLNCLPIPFLFLVHYCIVKPNSFFWGKLLQNFRCPHYLLSILNIFEHLNLELSWQSLFFFLSFFPDWFQGAVWLWSMLPTWQQWT